MKDDIDKVVELNSPKPYRDTQDAVYQCANNKCNALIYKGDHYYKMSACSLCLNCGRDVLTDDLVMA